jgi:hypothetical protein
LDDASQLCWLNELKFAENEYIVSESYKFKATFGLELIEAQTIGYVALLKSLESDIV